MSISLKPIISKSFCSPYLTTLMIRKRPNVVHGGGFVVTNCSTPKAIFTVDGCGVVGAKGVLVVRDEDGVPILRILKKSVHGHEITVVSSQYDSILGNIMEQKNKGGLVQVLSTGMRWKGYLADEERQNMSVFSLREPRTCLTKNEGIRIYIEDNRDWAFEVNGSFIDRNCTVNDRRDVIIAQVAMKETMGSKEFYQVVVQPGYDQAFVVGVIAVLDYIHGESTRCW